MVLINAPLRIRDLCSRWMKSSIKCCPGYKSTWWSELNTGEERSFVNRASASCTLDGFDCFSEHRLPKAPREYGIQVIFKAIEVEIAHCLNNLCYLRSYQYGLTSYWMPGHWNGFSPATLMLLHLIILHFKKILSVTIQPILAHLSVLIRSLRRRMKIRGKMPLLAHEIRPSSWMR